MFNAIRKWFSSRRIDVGDKVAIYLPNRVLTQGFVVKSLGSSRDDLLEVSVHNNAVTYFRRRKDVTKI